MQTSRIEDAPEYVAARHHGMRAVRLQGKEASRTSAVWVGLSTFEPGGGAEFYGSPGEKIYVVIDGEITVTTASGEVTLGPLDSCVIEADEPRGVENRSARPVRMLVIAAP